MHTPVVLLAALLIAVFPPLFVSADWGEWLYRGLVLLVIGCPCALVIFTPVSIVASLAAAARDGVLVKGDVHMEAPSTEGSRYGRFSFGQRSRLVEAWHL
jgi:Zn2+/Cd2+-exporting ATPase